ncbi:MAG TPA: hypothetical protein VL527_04310 [Dongiaceae bacterium]|nr:hypothetical protein [Dongiaceae bacterium]
MTDTRNIADVIALPDWCPENLGGYFLPCDFAATWRCRDDGEEAGPT